MGEAAAVATIQHTAAAARAILLPSTGKHCAFGGGAAARGGPQLAALCYHMQSTAPQLQAARPALQLLLTSSVSL